MTEASILEDRTPGFTPCGGIGQGPGLRGAEGKAIAGGRLTDLLAERSMFFVCGLLTFVFLLLFIKEEEEKIAEFEERHEHKTV